jgi:Carboxypeptidase regulatory-like domain
VTDPSGAIVPGATVVARDQATGLEHATVTTSDGQFVIQDLRVGVYKVTVTVAGFPTYVVDNVGVTAGADIYPARETLPAAAVNNR